MFQDCINEYKEAMKTIVKIIKIVDTLLRRMGEGERPKQRSEGSKEQAGSGPIEHLLSPKDLFGEIQKAINNICYQRKI